MKSVRGRELKKSKTRKDTEYFLHAFQETLRILLKDSGVNNATSISEKVIDSLRLKYSGIVIVFPKGDYKDTSKMRKNMLDSYTGNNLIEIALHHGVTQRHVRRCIKLEQARRRCV